MPHLEIVKEVVYADPCNWLTSRKKHHVEVKADCRTILLQGPKLFLTRSSTRCFLVNAEPDDERSYPEDTHNSEVSSKLLLHWTPTRDPQFCFWTHPVFKVPGGDPHFDFASVLNTFLKKERFLPSNLATTSRSIIESP